MDTAAAHGFHAFGVDKMTEIGVDKSKSIKMRKIPAEDRIRNFREVMLGYDSTEAKAEMSRCLLCKKEPKCIAGCPAHFDVQAFVKPASEGRLEDAMRELLNDSPFPATLARVCPHKCTKECIRGKKGEPIEIANIKRYITDNVDRTKLGIKPEPATGKKIAVIGAGPAGLTVAYRLALKGHRIDVFEELPVSGGMLYVGIPEYRLPRDVLNSEIDFIKSLGVSIHNNTRIESLDGLWKDGYEAIYIGTGAHLPQKLGVPGEDMEGVVHATTFLRDINLGKAVKLGERVAVVGGGNVAMDAVRVSVRLGAKKVFIVYRRTMAEMPADKSEIEDSEEEGVEIHILAAPVKILGSSGKVTGMECIKMELGEPDSSGRRRPVPVKGSEFTLDVDTVIPAISQSADTKWLPDTIKLTKWGTIEVDAQTGATSLRGVYAGGDNTLGPATVIQAIDAGNKAAAAIDAYLKSI